MCRVESEQKQIAKQRLKLPSVREQDSIRYFQQAIRNPLYAMPWRSYSAAGVCTLRTKNTKDAERRILRSAPFRHDRFCSRIARP